MRFAFAAHPLFLAAALSVVVACGSQSLQRSAPLVPLDQLLNNLTQLRPTGQEAGEMRPDKIIGDNDLLPVGDGAANIPAQFTGILDAIGIMSNNCTATHIGHGLVLTAGHCFRAPQFREDNVNCDNVTIRWGLRQNRPSALTSRCEAVLAQETSATLDYAILKVTPAPAAFVPVSRTRAVLGQKITIFGHPKQRPLEWSGACTVLDSANGDYGPAAFSHQCDTEEGNSGSTVLDYETGQIIGVHDGGVAPFNYGTHITETPIIEFERYYLGGEDLPPLAETEGTLVFGRLDLGHNQSNKLLVNLAKANKLMVNFTLTIDLETQSDFVVLEDASGRRSSPISGMDTFTMNSLKAPVKILYSSNDSGMSSLVKVTKISFQ